MAVWRRGTFRLPPFNVLDHHNRSKTWRSFVNDAQVKLKRQMIESYARCRCGLSMLPTPHQVVGLGYLSHPETRYSVGMLVPLPSIWEPMGISTVTMYKVNPSDVILVHDDLDRPLGKYSFKHGGSAGGHNRVKSAIASLHSDSLRRVRVGVGRPSKRDNVTEYVLSNFDPSERLVMERTIGQCCEVLMKELQLLRS